MLPSLRQQLLTLEDDFLSALSQGEAAIVAFEQRWQLLFAELDLAFGADEFDPDVLALAHTTAVRCATLADISIETFSSCETAGTELLEQLDSMMSELSIDPSTHPSRPSRKSTPVRQSQSPDPNSHDMSPPVTVSGSLKRRWEECSDAPQQVSKRSRVISSPRRPANTSKSRFSVQSPSPPPSDRSSTASLSPPVSVVGTHIDRHIQRKRRASDADLLLTPRPGQKKLCVGPRLHAVSDSYTPHALGLPKECVSHAPCPSAKDTSLAILEPSVQFDIQPFPGLASSLEYSPFESLSSFDATQDLILPELNGLDAFLNTLLDPVLSQNVDQLPFSDVHSSTDASEGSLSWPEATSSHRSLPSTPSSSCASSLPATPPSSCEWTLDGRNERSADGLRKLPSDSTIPPNTVGGSVVSRWPSLFHYGDSEAVVSFPSNYFTPFDVGVLEDWMAPSLGLLPVISS